MRKPWVITAAVLLAVLLSGCIWQYCRVQAETRQYSAPGSYVDTGAYSMHYVSEGAGETAIVFISGSGTPCAYTDFYALQESLSSLGQAISFDRAGSGWSTNTDEPRTVENLEAELTALLDAAAPGKPVVLVAHSLGSLEALYYAQCHPDRVCGIVFLDSGDPEFYRADSEFTAKLLNRGLSILRGIGVNRLLCKIEKPLPIYGERDRLKGLPEELRGLDKAMFNRHTGSRENLKGIAEMNENAAKVAAGPRLGSIPILVLSSDSGEAWGVVQSTLAGWSENSRQVTIAGAAHYLHWSNAAEAETEIRLFAEAVLR